MRIIMYGGPKMITHIDKKNLEKNSRYISSGRNGQKVSHLQKYTVSYCEIYKSNF